ncbi:UNVERIFIED_CONTAM: hypothetical protein FKN15_046150 [Acipenser sinensis]
MRLHISIILEGGIVMSDITCMPEALVVLFGLLYALHLNYPKRMSYTLEVIQKVFLSLGDDKLKPKLL